jgi:hypothetical protein
MGFFKGADPGEAGHMVDEIGAVQDEHMGGGPDVGLEPQGWAAMRGEFDA